MRVLFVINSLGAGGTERSTAVLLPYLRDRGVEPTVVALLHRDEGDEAWVCAQGIDVRVLAPAPLPAQVLAVRRLIGRLRPDVVHTAIFEADVVGRLAAVGTGVPVLSSLVNTPYDAARRADPRVVPWKLEVVRRIDAVTGRFLTAHVHAVTQGVADDGVATLGLRRERISVVERGRDPERLGRRSPSRRAAARAGLGIEGDRPVVLTVGRQEFQKAQADLVAAMVVVAAERPDVVTLVAGRTGNASAELAAAVDGAGPDVDVRLLGHRDDVAELLTAADVFVLPSRYEGTAGAALEALALEAPVVATELVGTRGVLVDGENARLVPVADPPALAAAVAEVLRDPDGARARAERGRADFESRFTLDGSADRMVALYRRVAAMPGVLGGRRRPRAGTDVGGPAGTGAGTGPGAGVGAGAGGAVRGWPASRPAWVPTELAASGPGPAIPAGDRFALPTLGPGETRPELSVILCVHDGADVMAGQLDALVAQVWDRPWELVVVDNRSTDATAVVAARYAAAHDRVRVVRAPDRAGLSHARNVGVAAARAAAVAFCDDDDEVGAGWVAAMGEALRDHPVAASRMEYERLSDPAAVVGRAGFQSDGIEHVFGRPIVNGASGWQRWVWAALSGNDEELDFSGEDHDMALRAHEVLGIEPTFVADAVYHCRRRQGLGPTFRQARRYGRAQVLLYRRHGRGVVSPEPVRVVARQWAWLALHAADTRRPATATRWGWRVGLRVGRLEGSVAERTRYL